MTLNEINKQYKLDWKLLNHYNKNVQFFNGDNQIFFDNFGYPINIPVDIDDCLLMLDNLNIYSEDIEYFINLSEQECIDFFKPIKKYIINYWFIIPEKYSKNSILMLYFNEKEIIYKDDVVNLIIISYHRYLNNKKIELEKQISNILMFYSKYN
jgi:hypothetical protein